MNPKLLGILAIAGGIAPHLVFAIPETTASSSIEKEVLRISRQLKPIPDDVWKTVAGTKGEEKYKIVVGDTLSDISKRLFGDPKYWPKVWSLNNSSITNPHLIRPGKMVAFLAGSGTDLPSVAVMTDDSGPVRREKPKNKKEEASDSFPKSQSNEWNRLPQQRWEMASTTIPEGMEQIDLGKEAKEKIKVINSSVTFSLKSLAASQVLNPLAEITAATKPALHLTAGDRVFIRARKEKLQIGQTYAATTSEPTPLISKRKDLKGYAYTLMGSILILDEVDGLYVGKVLTAGHPISRGAVLIPLPDRIPLLEPIVGPKTMNASLLVDSEHSTSTIAQHKQIFVDRGSEDGLKPGMVFKVYQYEDPFTELTYSQKNIEKQGELMVTQVSERFSSAIVLRSDTPLFEGMTAILTSDQKLAEETKPLVSADTPPQAPSQVDDDLDRMDQGDDLNANEKRELKQLEGWKGNPPSPAPNPEASPIPAVTPEATPSPSPPSVE